MARGREERADDAVVAGWVEGKVGTVAEERLLSVGHLVVSPSRVAAMAQRRQTHKLRRHTQQKTIYKVI